MAAKKGADRQQPAEPATAAPAPTPQAGRPDTGAKNGESAVRPPRRSKTGTTGGQAKKKARPRSRAKKKPARTRRTLLLALLEATCLTITAVTAELERQLPQLARADIARTALKARGLILEVGGVAEAIELANDIAIEHLELQVTEPWQWLAKIRHAGAIFLGSWTPEAAGDYVAGPNHVLPTMGTARIASALGVETFLKKSSIISYSREALIADGDHIRRLAALEGLTAHGNSVAVRLGKAGR